MAFAKNPECERCIWVPAFAGMSGASYRRSFQP